MNGADKVLRKDLGRGSQIDLWRDHVLDRKDDVSGEK